MITVSNLKIGHYETIAQCSSLQLDKGVLYALVGNNGSGKSTFFKTICGIIPAISGELILFGKPLSSLSHLERSKTIAFVESKFSGVELLSVAEYIGLGRAPYTGISGRLSQHDFIKIEETISFFGIQDLKNRFTDTLSDGERQLCAIARAVVQETPFIVLDEPTSSLDFRNKKLIMQKLKEIAEKENKCILLSTHDIELTFEFDCQLLGVFENEISMLKEMRYEDLKEKLLA